MKCFSRVLLLISLLLSGCTAKHTEVTQEEVIAAYESAGYVVWSHTYDAEMDSGIIAYVQADDPDGDYIHFAFFKNEEDAKDYKKDLDHPVMKGLFSIIYGDPMWERMETYGSIVVTYWEPEFFKPFEELLESK